MFAFQILSTFMINSICLFKHSIFKPNKYKRIRIPCILTLQSGRVLACFEGRKSASDWAKIDIIYCYSDDNGASFCSFKTAVAENNFTINNPCMVQDCNGTVHLMYCKNYAVPNKGGVFIKSSTDNGTTFGAERNITASFAPLNASVIAIGPAHGIKAKDNTLVFTLWYVKATESKREKSHHPAHITTIYSKDNGVSWQLGEPIPTTLQDPNETAICNHNDGVLISARVHKLGYRATSFSPTGYNNWQPLLEDNTLPDPTCQGSLISDQNNTFFANCNSTKGRKNLTVYKYNDGFHPTTLISKSGGYSDLTIANNKLIILYEQHFGKRINLAVLDI